ncbi:MAG: hypothetical protein KAR79_00390 [Simkaniaceae bacterium]|nr:hypothetical protein [Simkaniaceae bacterium]
MTYKTEPRSQIHQRPNSTQKVESKPKRPFPKIESKKRRENQKKTPDSNYYQGVFDMASEYYADRILQNANAASALTSTSAMDPSTEIAQLMEKLVQMIRQETNKGISITTIEIQMENEGSILNGVEVVFKHYDTAPDAFNIEFNGTEDALAYLQQSTPLLASSLKEQFPKHRFQFKSSLAKRKEKKKLVHKLN